MCQPDLHLNLRPTTEWHVVKSLVLGILGIPSFEFQLFLLCDFEQVT